MVYNMVFPSDNFFKQYYNTVDELLDSDYTGRIVKIYYPARRIECTNCVFNPMPGGGSTNVYKSGGPVPFTIGNCPVCGGKGFKEEESTENIRSRIYWEHKDWRKIANTTEIPDGRVMIISYMSNLSKVKRGDSFRLYQDIEHQNYWDYKLALEPTPHGFGSKYFKAFLDRL